MIISLIQDQHLIVTDIPGLEDHSIYAVFDGHGGKTAAVIAAEGLVKYLLEVPALQDYKNNQVKQCLNQLHRVWA